MAKDIVVIDDEEDVREVIRAVLISKGHQVRTAANGQEGMDLMEAKVPDLILCDLMMPRVSGLEVLKRVKRHQRLRTVPMIIISALGDEQRPPEFWIRTLGVDDYIMKPFDPLDLMGRVEFVLRKGGYVSTRAESTADEAKVRVSTADLGTAAPQEVVRTFIEAWNGQDFSTEFRSMGGEMLGGMGAEDYVARRQQIFAEERAQNRRQRVLAVEEEKISLNVAKVTIAREDVVSGEAKTRRESYSLKKTYLGWKIIGCRSAK